MSRPQGWGGRRPGSGRKPLPASRRKESRRVSLAPGLWERIDAAQEARGLTRTAAFESMAEAWFAANDGGGGQ